MQRFELQAVSQHIQRIILPCGVCVYLVQGTNGAVLLDTGFGIGDLRGFVESLITTPYHVWLSHGHLDHAGGSAQFEEVFLSPADFALENGTTSGKDVMMKSSADRTGLRQILRRRIFSLAVQHLIAP